jgi:hypothetical protein
VVVFKAESILWKIKGLGDKIVVRIFH